MTDLEAADGVLAIVCSTVNFMRLSACKDALERLAGRGVTIGPSDDPIEDGEDYTMFTEADRTRAVVDVRRVLAEVLTVFGLTVSDGPAESFLHVAGPSIPASCEAFFLLDNAVPPYAARATAKAGLCIVIHANDGLPADYNTFAHSLGVHTVRLAEVGRLTAPDLDQLARTIAAARRVADAVAAGGGPAANAAAKLIAAAKEMRPEDVEVYASTAKDDLFEAATARIVEPLVGGVLALGSRYRGKPIPDGLLVDDLLGRSPAAATYDCKSKAEDFYGLDAAHADQQARYVAIQDRLRDDYSWKPVGAVIFTPAVDQQQFDEKMQKEFWRQFSDKGLHLLVVRASVLRRWYDLEQLEAPGALGLHFNQGAFWKALFFLTLPTLGEAEQGKLLGDRSRKLRLVTVEEAELAYLAGLARQPQAVRSIESALRGADPDHIKPGSVGRPALLQKYFASLKEKKADLAKLHTVTGLSPVGVEYLLRSEDFFPQGPAEMGPYGVENLNRLRALVGAKPAAT